MIRSFTTWIHRSAGDWRLVLGVLAVQMLVLLAMFQIARPFRAIVGFDPFDFQPELTSSDMAQQLTAYTAPARQLYYGMAAIDFVFPALGGLFWALLLAAGLRLGWPDEPTGSNLRWWLLLPFLGTLCDWTENVFNLIVIAGYPPQSATMTSAALAAKQAKFSAVMLAATAAVLTFAIGLARYVRRPR